MFTERISCNLKIFFIYTYLPRWADLTKLFGAPVPKLLLGCGKVWGYKNRRTYSICMQSFVAIRHAAGDGNIRSFFVRLRVTLIGFERE